MTDTELSDAVVSRCYLEAKTKGQKGSCSRRAVLKVLNAIAHRAVGWMFSRADISHSGKPGEISQSISALMRCGVIERATNGRDGSGVFRLLPVQHWRLTQ